MIKKEKNQKFNLRIKSKDIDPGALFIIEKLNDSGYEALAVGGCIRNLVMGEKANDWDVTTSATPEEISLAFKGFKVIPVGKKFGTVTVVIEHTNYEVSAFKKNKSVQTPNLFEDLRHRDFTINALAWKNGEGVIDCFNGLEDIKQKIIRGVENPCKRIEEDPLRMLRAGRLACELDFKIDKTTLQAIKENSSLIKKVSQERIRDELIRMLLSNYPQRGLKLLEQGGLLKYILSELMTLKGVKIDDIYPVEDLFTYNLKLVDHLPPNLVLRLTALLSFPFSTPREETVLNILNRLKFKSSIIKKVILLWQDDWGRIYFSQEKEIRKYLAKMSLEEVKNIFILKKAALKVKKRDKEEAQLKQEEERVKAVLAQKPPLSLKDLALKGQDLKHLGYSEGKKLGQVLKELLNLVLEKPALNQKKILIAWVKSERPPGN